MRGALREKRRSGVSADQVLRCATLKPTAAATTPTTSRTQYSHSGAALSSGIGSLLSRLAPFTST
jgi:hypothetical protein